MELHNQKINMDKNYNEIIERIKKLEDAVFGGALRSPRKGLVVSQKHRLDFSMNERAFIKKYFLKFNGQETFTLICSFLAKGRNDAPVDLSLVKKTWKNCQGLIGYPYSSIYSTRAKENVWVDIANNTRATYTLGKNWMEIFKKHVQPS